MYCRIGHDWDGFGVLIESASVEQGPQISLVPEAMMAQAQVPLRVSLPAGSIVPTLRARPIVKMRPLTEAGAAKILAQRMLVLDRITKIKRLPAAQFDEMARRHADRAKALYGLDFGAASGGGTSGLSDYERRMIEIWETMERELVESRRTVSENLQYQIGGNALAQRAGDISAALGLDMTWEDIRTTAGRELARIRQAGSILDEELLNTAHFDRLAATFMDQGYNLGEFADFARSAMSGYDAIRAGYNEITADAAAFGEGGLRRLVESMMTDVSFERPDWLTGENLERVSSAATAWAGAAQSSEASGYVKAAGTTVALAGAAIPQPAGIIVSAVGALISIIGSLLPDDDPPPPPRLYACTGEEGRAYNVLWAYNPEAWTALAFWLVAKDGYQDSEIYKEAVRSRRLVQDVIVTDYRWSATIDRYTGEVMVREPSSSPSTQNPPRRLLDLIDRDLLIPAGRPREAVEKFNEMAAAFGAVPRDSHWNGRSFLWCLPNPEETFTRFVDADRYLPAGGVKPFRRSTTDRSAPEEIGFDILGSEEFWKTYRAAMIASMYLGGTVPYGVKRASTRGNPVGVSTGMGARSGGSSITIYTDPFGVPTVNTSSWTETRRPGMEYLRRYVQDDATRLANRIPNPSPIVQGQPGLAVLRSMRGVMDITRLLPAGAVFKRQEPGLSKGTKWGIGLGAAALAAGGGYWWWRRRNRG